MWSYYLQSIEIWKLNWDAGYGRSGWLKRSKNGWEKNKFVLDIYSIYIFAYYINFCIVSEYVEVFKKIFFLYYVLHF